MIAFEWNTLKAASNLKKHGVSFGEAQSVFYDDQAFVFDDVESLGEERFILLGMGSLSRVVVVVYCERGDNGEVLRIISARKATVREQRYYQGE
jgi:uncharacterized DUF497 family protein